MDVVPTPKRRHDKQQTNRKNEKTKCQHFTKLKELQNDTRTHAFTAQLIFANLNINNYEN